MICIVDYGMGNLRSVHKAVERVGFKAQVTSDPTDIEGASKLILPGVGAFADCMQNLTRHDLMEPVISFIQSGKPFLGICLGLQLLFEESDEFGHHKGMAILPGKVTRFPDKLTDPDTRERYPIPHMGWNAVHFSTPTSLFEGVQSGSYFYFVHSYYALPDNPQDTIGTTSYGIDFTSAVQRNNIMAVQFHPEKSHTVGLQLLRNFGGLVA